MKKLTKYVFLFFVPALLLLQQCKKDTPDTTTPNPQPTQCDTCLPAITTTGANTFGCRVNGKVWLPVGGSSNPAVWEEYTASHQLIVHGYNDNTVQWLSFAIEPLTDTGYYNLFNPSFKTQWGSYIISTQQNNTYYEADTIQKGYIHILKIDLIKGIFSGTFTFDLYDIYHQHNNDTIHITDGRFDSHL